MLILHLNTFRLLKDTATNGNWPVFGIIIFIQIIFFAMVINDIPALACETFLKNLKSNIITIRPLRKFPVVHDLIVDRSSIHENLKRTNVFIGEYQPQQNEDFRHQYDAAKCLKCGLCLEVCPMHIETIASIGKLNK